MAEGWRWSRAGRGPPRPSPRRAVSVCESLDLQGVPAVQAALRAAQQQRRRPKSFCAAGNGLAAGALLPPPPPARARGGLLDFFRLRSPRGPAGQGQGQAQAQAQGQGEGRGQDQGALPEGADGAQRPRPSSMTFLPTARPAHPAESSGFLRGGSLWGSRRWNLFGGSGRSSPGPRKNFSSLRKSFSFRLRRGHELRRSESGGLLRPARLRTKSEGDASSLHTCPSKRDLLYPELARVGGRLHTDPGQAGGLWRLLTSRFRRRERGSTGSACSKDPHGSAEPVLLGSGPLRALGK